MFNLTLSSPEGIQALGKTRRFLFSPFSLCDAKQTNLKNCSDVKFYKGCNAVGYVVGSPDCAYLLVTSGSTNKACFERRDKCVDMANKKAECEAVGINGAASQSIARKNNAMIDAIGQPNYLKPCFSQNLARAFQYKNG